MDGVRFQVEHGKDETVLVHLWQVWSPALSIDGIKLQEDVVGLDLTALIDRWQVVE
jgi:hypothetical protein